MDVRRNEPGSGNGIVKINSSEIEEVISAVPKWILRWGISIIFLILIAIVTLASFIEYPDIVKTPLTIISTSSPKSVVALKNGRLSKIFVSNGDRVRKGQILAYLETTADPEHVIRLGRNLKKLSESKDFAKVTLIINSANGFSLGEIQSDFQVFYQRFIEFQSATDKGVLIRRRTFLERDIHSINDKRSQILKKRAIQNRIYENSEKDFEAYNKLYNNKVISRAEFIQRQNLHLSSRYPLQQTETELLENADIQNAKLNEISELDNMIVEQQLRFRQALYNILSVIDSWISQYVLKSKIEGTVNFAGSIQQFENVYLNQEIFVINPKINDYFAEIQIPQYNMGKIKLNQKTLIKLNSYPFEEYGMLEGKIYYLADVPLRDSAFLAKLHIDSFRTLEGKRIVLKNGLQGIAEIITENSSLLSRFYRNLRKVFRDR